MLGRSGFVGGIFKNYGKGIMTKTEKYIHEKEHDEQAMVKEAAV